MTKENSKFGNQPNTTKGSAAPQPITQAGPTTSLEPKGASKEAGLSKEDVAAKNQEELNKLSEEKSDNEKSFIDLLLEINDEKMALLERFTAENKKEAGELREQAKELKTELDKDKASLKTKELELGSAQLDLKNLKAERKPESPEIKAAEEKVKGLQAGVMQAKSQVEEKQAKMAGLETKAKAVVTQSYTWQALKRLVGAENSLGKPQKEEQKTEKTNQTTMRLNPHAAKKQYMEGVSDKTQQSKGGPKPGQVHKNTQQPPPKL